jgi:hypothetical protein
MKWTWLRAAVMGFLLGPAPLPAEPAEVEIEPDRFAAAGPTGRAERGARFYVWDEDEIEAATWATELRGSAPEEDGWRSLAASSAAMPAMLTRDLEAVLARGIDSASGSASPLGALLCLLPGLDRTCLVSSWATSPDERLRIALARALAAPFEAVGVRSAIDQLQRDPSPEVRRLARAAEASRRESGAAGFPGSRDSPLRSL